MQDTFEVGSQETTDTVDYSLQIRFFTNQEYNETTSDSQLVALKVQIKIKTKLCDLCNFVAKAHSELKHNATDAQKNEMLFIVVNYFKTIFFLCFHSLS